MIWGVMDVVVPKHFRKRTFLMGIMHTAVYFFDGAVRDLSCTCVVNDFLQCYGSDRCDLRILLTARCNS